VYKAIKQKGCILNKRILVKYKADLIIISLKIKLFSPWYSWQIVELAL